MLRAPEGDREKRKEVMLMDIRTERTYYLSIGLLIGLLFALASYVNAIVPGGICMIVLFVWAIMSAQDMAPNRR